jgi:2-keto-4-pentenoate hydratase/2-oxohepta-3-ene-1,7-dioic acid hydratase in catechol pathway
MNPPLVLPIKGGGWQTLSPSKIIAVGLNYHDHVQESLNYNAQRLGLPERPVLFCKTPNVLIGPESPIVLPQQPYIEGFENPRTDFEAELAIVIGKPCKRISVQEATQVCAFYTCFNDVSQRNIQKSDPSGWFRGKSFDTFGPIGPILVPFEELGPEPDLWIRAILNGKVMQEARTSQMIFKPLVLVAYISQNISLIPGDVIITGTPGGIGELHPGDTIEIQIEGIGSLINPVVSESI